ncbi:MAG: GIY-YIG nuclease family protein [Thermoplasmata archaeon]|nr:MAG: GIY-YIG nuclease family protein [Thermoplasmata archaeon]
MKGTYALLMHLEDDKNIRIGSLGSIDFLKGHYLYIGSGMNGIEGRVRRHLRDKKKNHWHIDYFLEKVKITNVYYINKKRECILANNFSQKFEVVPRFGSSDCNCKGHLFYGGHRELVDCALQNRLSILNLTEL